MIRNAWPIFVLGALPVDDCTNCSGIVGTPDVHWGGLTLTASKIFQRHSTPTQPRLVRLATSHHLSWMGVERHRGVFDAVKVGPTTVPHIWGADNPTPISGNCPPVFSWSLGPVLPVACCAVYMAKEPTSCRLATVLRASERSLAKSPRV